MDVAPGTIVIIDAAGYEMIQFAESKTLRKCRFEAVYQGSPASRIFGEDVDEQRIQIGMTAQTSLQLVSTKKTRVELFGRLYCVITMSDVPSSNQPKNFAIPG
jgi:hypothetical protein